MNSSQKMEAKVLTVSEQRALADSIIASLLKDGFALRDVIMVSSRLVESVTERIGQKSSAKNVVVK
jgi:hypothetical protein